MSWLVVAGAMGVVTCSRSEPEGREDGTSPQSGQGAILDAARRAADTANRQVEAIEESGAAPE